MRKILSGFVVNKWILLADAPAGLNDLTTFQRALPFVVAQSLSGFFDKQDITRSTRVHHKKM